MKNPFLEGKGYLSFIHSIEDKCSIDSNKVISKKESNLNKKVEKLGNVLSLLHRLSCCYWDAMEKST